MALALVGAARRLGVTARSAEVRGRWQVAVSDAAQAVALLDRIDTANRQRAAMSGVTAAARVRAALTILGDDAPASPRR